jgi:hypothetical protein
MKKRLLSAVIAGFAIAALLAAAPIAQAGDTSDTISVKFGADDPSASWINALLPTDHAGVPPYTSANWNNAGGQNDFTYADPAKTLGTPNVVPLGPLVRDANGVASTSNATISWSSNNTWSSRDKGENNNNFPFHGPDFWLMSGYLDTSDLGGGKFIDIEITGLDADMAAGYSVVIYTMGGVPNRPAAYFVNDPTQAHPKYVVPSGDQGQFNGAYQQATGDDPAFGANDFGNYVVFTGLHGDVSIQGEPRNFRAAINAIQIVKNQ